MNDFLSQLQNNSYDITSIQWIDGFMDVDRIPFAIIAILITIVIGMITGPIAGNANPLWWGIIDRLFGRFGDKGYKPSRKRGDLAFRGFLVTALILLFTLGFIYSLKIINYRFAPYNIVEIFILCLLITSGSVWFALLRLYTALDQGKVGTGAYFAIARTARRNMANDDDYGITRTAMQMSAKTLDKGLVTPILWYLMGGLPLALVYAALASVTWRFGRDGTTKGFADVMFAMERLMGFIFSIYTAILISIAALFTPKASTIKGITAWMGMKNRATYEQGGAPLSVLAWVLKVSLGGASKALDSAPIKTPWVGPEGATAKVSHKDLRYTIYINIVTHILFIASLTSAYIWGTAL